MNIITYYQSDRFNKRYSVVGLIIALTMLCCHLSAQVSYTYDNAGNRLSRTIVMPGGASRVRGNLTPDSTAQKDAIANHEITIYPNPTKGVLKVQINGLTDTDKATIALSDMKGNVLITRQVGELIETLDITSMPDGVYLIKIIYGTDVKIWKIIKQ